MTYVAPANRFIRWWDPSLDAGNTLGYSGLRSHLRELRRIGLILNLTRYTSVGMQGDSSQGWWFNFLARGRARAGAPYRIASGKGSVDCRSGKLAALVFGW